MNNFDNKNVAFCPQPMQAPLLAMPVFPPQMIPVMPQAMPILPPCQPMPSNVCEDEPKLFDLGSSSIIEAPQNMLQKNEAGQFVCPTGYSFVRMAVSSSVESSIEPLTSEQEFARDIENFQDNISNRSRSPSVAPETLEAKPSNNKRFRHRSKQERILEVHAELKERYTQKGLYAAEDEVLRGFDTVRVHVKTYHALNKIECPLNDIEKHPNVTVLRIATPFSMKNKFQKKGFIVYLKLADERMVPIVQSIFANYSEHFAKCDVALKKEDKEARLRQAQDTVLPELDVVKAASMKGEDYSNWAKFSENAFSGPPRMHRQRSGALAA